MLPLIEIPEIVRHYAPWFEGVFTPEAWVQFQRYLSGLLVSENKTVEGINRLFVVESRNQSSLNWLLTGSPYSEEALNKQRLALLNSLPQTRIKPRKGVLSLDDTLLSHYGQEFDQITKLWDPVNKRWTQAHNLVNLHYSDEQTDYPLAYQLWQPADLEKLEKGLPAAGVQLRASKFTLKQDQPRKWRHYLIGVWRRNQTQPEVATLYQSKLLIGRAMLQQWVQENPTLTLPITFDSWYTQPAFCRYLDQELNLSYVGTLANDDQVLLKQEKLQMKAYTELSNLSVSFLAS